MGIGGVRSSRFSAERRSYTYKICTIKDPFKVYTHWFVANLVPVETGLNQAIKILLATEDFSSFMKSNSDSEHARCRLYYATWEKASEYEFVFQIEANRFLRNMVRAIVGTLVAVAKGNINPGEFKHIIEKKDRSFAGESAPAHGLYLKEVTYPQSVYI